ncbi:LPD16 domain-containing protein [Listeria seeligeri]|uniref:LPD16 domain-containing protein n=1 Tax=Listeria seeligeri TaxID=1640 RepID=UPI0018889FA5|nr:LPD16 domain-containing protein [Listeria seeligeri]MBF2599142.1 hypothetical protein [Listeria seeligeri]
MNENTELAVKIADKFIEIHESDEGIEYSIFDSKYYLLDGGVLELEDTLGIPVYIALAEIIDFHDLPKLEMEKINYEDLIEKTVERELVLLEKLVQKSKPSLLEKISDFVNPPMQANETRNNSFEK